MNRAQPQPAPNGDERPQTGNRLPTIRSNSSDQPPTPELARESEKALSQREEEEKSSTSQIAHASDLLPPEYNRINTNFSGSMGGACGSFRSSTTGLQSLVSSMSNSVRSSFKFAKSTNSEIKKQGNEINDPSKLNRLEMRVYSWLLAYLERAIQTEFADWTETRRAAVGPKAGHDLYDEREIQNDERAERTSTLYDEYLDNVLSRLKKLLERQHFIKDNRYLLYLFNQPRALIHEVLHDKKCASEWLKNREEYRSVIEDAQAHQGRFRPNLTPTERYKLENGQQLEYVPILADIESRGILTAAMRRKLEDLQDKVELYRKDAFPQPSFPVTHAVI